MGLKHALLVLLTTLVSLTLQLEDTLATIAKPGCQEKCGNITIPYPFGIGVGCYLDKPFEVTCNEQLGDLSLSFRSVLQLSLESVRIMGGSFIDCLEPGSDFRGALVYKLDKQFSYSYTDNKFVAIGCDIFAYITDSGTLNYTSGCTSICNNDNPLIELSPSSCSGMDGCCQTSIPNGFSSFDMHKGTISKFNQSRATRPCSIAFIAAKDFYGFFFNTSELTESTDLPIAPLVLNWVVGETICKVAQERENYACGLNSECIDSTQTLGYRCQCLPGFQGNPYLGCQDINECDDGSISSCQEEAVCINLPGSYFCSCPHGYNGDGKENGYGCKRDRGRHTLVLVVASGTMTMAAVLLLTAFGYLVSQKLEGRKRAKTKQKFFERNGGLLLQQQLSASDQPSILKTQLYTTEEMEKATDNFKKSRVLGHGGHGTVYKGMLPDGTIVAVKKSNVVDKTQLGCFINEIFILSQINHRNIVKLLGCCLEYEVPLLVYEYVSNGTLSCHLHDKGTISWETRLRIAGEVAGALAYLHSCASTAIFHRDVKSSNILLDENYRAVVSDFGLSRSIHISRTHLTTLVGGTFGYLDPDYFRSGQFTDKSDVYAFGVVLAELLTGRKAASARSSDEGLVIQLQSSMKQDKLYEIVDSRVVSEGLEEEILAVAKLAKRCVKLNAKMRPSMKEVVLFLDSLRNEKLMLHVPRNLC